MSLFRLDASIRTEGSSSRAIADLVEASWREHRPDDEILTRHLGLEPIPAGAWSAAVGAGWTPAEQRSPEQVAAVELAATIVDELVAADALLFAVPLYNFGVSQHFKAWVDLALTDPRLSPSAAEPALAGKPAVLATVRGGNYSPGTPRHGWDHATPWMQRILADVWQLDLEVVEREFTLVGVNPALDEFAEIADQLRIEAEANARRTGHSLAHRQLALA
jgi:FMN-dependent NADH-azoreductase